jgi:hypothetical protein
MIPRRVTFNADANILYSQVKENRVEAQSMNIGEGSDSTFLKEVSLNGKRFDVESTAPFEKVRVDGGAKQESPNFTDREPMKYEFTTSGRRR